MGWADICRRISTVSPVTRPGFSRINHRAPSGSGFSSLGGRSGPRDTHYPMKQNYRFSDDSSSSTPIPTDEQLSSDHPTVIFPRHFTLEEFKSSMTLLMGGVKRDLRSKGVTEGSLILDGCPMDDGSFAGVIHRDGTVYIWATLRGGVVSLELFLPLGDALAVFKN